MIIIIITQLHHHCQLDVRPQMQLSKNSLNGADRQLPHSDLWPDLWQELVNVITV